MNYELAIMALEGLGKSPIHVGRGEDGVVKIEGSSAGLKDLARLCLLLGGADVAAGESFELEPGVHVTRESPPLHLRLSKGA